MIFFKVSNSDIRAEKVVVCSEPKIRILLEHDKGVMLLRHDKNEWFKGCIVGYRLRREGNHAISGAVGLGEKGGFKRIQVCVVLEKV